uniref:Uncharacterized protein n=1 Tax=Glossina austeni TaxID=7395 RepID=A0A1A9UHL5_GLOAU
MSCKRKRITTILQIYVHIFQHKSLYTLLDMTKFPETRKNTQFLAKRTCDLYFYKNHGIRNYEHIDFVYSNPDLNIFSLGYQLLCSGLCMREVSLYVTWNVATNDDQSTMKLVPYGSSRIVARRLSDSNFVAMRPLTLVKPLNGLLLQSAFLRSISAIQILR